MTSKTITLTREDSRLDHFPDLPPREDMHNTSHLHLRSVLTSLLIHFASRERALVHGEVPGAPTLERWRGSRRCDDRRVGRRSDACEVSTDGGGGGQDSNDAKGGGGDAGEQGAFFREGIELAVVGQVAPMAEATPRWPRPKAARPLLRESHRGPWQDPSRSQSSRRRGRLRS